MFLENSSRNEKKSSAPKFEDIFSWLMIKLCQSECLSPSIMCENAAFCKVDVNLIKIDYSGDPKSCLINKFCISL